MVVTDDNTSKHCLPLLKEIPFDLHYELKSGEANKTVGAYLELVEYLMQHKLDRNTLLIALGGGMVTDLVGYAASTYKRGIRYINVPTSLLGMVDASIGGKTGVDHQSIKNIIGSIYPPFAILSNAAFLKTLPVIELQSGWAEVVKHLLLANQTIPTQIPDMDNDSIAHWSSIKHKIVLSDPYEKNKRLALNAGHTVGHALESIMIHNNHHLPHGHAVAAGLLIESNITKDEYNDAWAYDQLVDAVPAVFSKIQIKAADIPTILQFMSHDKKNQHNDIKCALIKAKGEAWVTTVNLDVMENALLKYINS